MRHLFCKSLYTNLKKQQYLTLERHQFLPTSKCSSRHSMPYTIQQIERDGEHQWAVLSCSCNLLDANDLLLLDTVALVRRSYGEDAVVQDAQDVMADEIVGGTFSLDHLITAIRMGMPDPDAEGNKPRN
jgi:hypothetical protein